MQRIRNLLSIFHGIARKVLYSGHAVVRFVAKPFPPDRPAAHERVFEFGESSEVIAEICRRSQYGYVAEASVPPGYRQKVEQIATTLAISSPSLNRLITLLKSSNSQRLWIMGNSIVSKAMVFIVWIQARTLKKVGPLKRLKINGQFVGIEIVRNRSRPTPQTRWFIDRTRLPQFFESLEEANIRYVLLRWWHMVSDLPENEDLDILVEDEDYNEFASIASVFYGDAKIDIYSSSGRSGANWNALPYYPTNLAMQILDNRVKWKSICFIPNARLFFLSLAYHLVFHKGTKSGLLRCSGEPLSIESSDHDYLAHLSKAADAARVRVSITLDDLYDNLESNGWLPPLDTLRELTLHNEWLANKVESPTLRDNEGDLIVFVLRSAVAEDNLVEAAREWIQYHGFEIIHEVNLTGEKQQQAATFLRGGCWHQGPYPRSGGWPFLLLVAYDYRPHPNESTGMADTYIVNNNVNKKHLLRRQLERQVTEDRRCNYVHTSDDIDEALTYISVVCPDEKECILERKEALDAIYFHPKWQVVRVMGGWGDRAKVELVFDGHNYGVKKTFRRGMQRFLGNEMLVYRAWKNSRSWLPSLWECGENYFVTEFIEDKLLGVSDSRRAASLQDMGCQIVGIMKELFDQGIALLDLNPRNVLIKSDGQLLLCDFEFAYKYPNKPGKFLDSYDVVGPPDDFEGDLPGMDREFACWYSKTWQSIFECQINDLKGEA